MLSAYIDQWFTWSKIRKMASLEEEKVCFNICYCSINVCFLCMHNVCKEVACLY